MKKNQIIAIVFVAIVIFSGMFYYKIVDLGEGRIDKGDENDAYISSENESNNDVSDVNEAIINQNEVVNSNSQ